MASKALQRYDELKAIVEPVLAIDSQDNYAELDDAVASITTELELTHEFTSGDVDDIETIVGDWWWEVDHNED